MKLLGKFLEKRKNKINISLSDKDIFYIFNRVIKEEFGNFGNVKLTPDFFKNKTIFVKSHSAVWGSELFSNRAEIIKKINKELGENTVKEIRLK